MPELPDVEHFRRYVNATALHHRVRSVAVRAPDMLEGISRAALARRLNGAAFSGTRRHGKYLFVDVDGAGALVLHFGMTGDVRYYSGGDPPDYTRLLINFANGYHLAYIAPRKLGLIGWTDDADAYIADKGLGPDALGLSVKAFLELAAGQKGALKPWLMNQARIAGIGNVYADEILFQARLHPKRPVADLSEARLKDLHRVLQRVLKAAIKAHADPARMPDSFLLAHREGDGRCPGCGGKLKTLEASGRTAYYCPRCQQP